MHSDDQAKQELLDDILGWSPLTADPRLREIDPKTRDLLIQKFTELAEMDVAQKEEGAGTQAVLGKHVFNFRTLAKPAITAIIVHAIVIWHPELDSPLLNWLDVMGFAEQLRHVYEQLNDDELEVFGAVSDLYAHNERVRSLAWKKQLTGDGVAARLAMDKIVIDNVDAVLESLYNKGALVKQGEGEPVLYAPSFLGRNSPHE